MKTTLHFPDWPIMMRELVKATAAITVPDLHATWRDPDPTVHPAKISLRRNAEGMHSVAMAEMVRRGEIVARSALYRTPYPDFDVTKMDDCMVTFADAQAFCRSLDIDLLPEAEPAPAEAAPPADVALPDDMQEPMRRLAALRAIGGNAEGRPGHWDMKGIVKLERQEKEKGRPRSSQKTIRKDLEKAADWEAEQKRGGAAMALP